MRRTILIFPLVLLITAITLLVYGSLRVPSPTFTTSLHELLPPPPPGWSVKEKPIADSAEMQEAVGELLNFDDGVFVDYLGPGDERISVYVAYWRPGKMSHRLIASHTPDVCWVGNGWKKKQASRLPPFSLSTGPAQVTPDASTPAGEARLFIANGISEYVWFWHLVGDESKSYGTGYAPPWHAAIKDIVAKGLNQRQEQFFIRLSSSRPLDEQLKGPVLKSILEHLPWPSTEPGQR